MDAKGVEAYFEELFAQFKYHLKGAKLAGDSKSIHDYRVAYKQLQALGLFLNSRFGEEDAATYNNWLGLLTPMYKKGGKSRNCTVLWKLGNRIQIWDNNPEMEVLLLAKKEQRHLNFTAFIQKYHPPTPKKIAALFSKNSDLLNQKPLTHLRKLIYQQFATILNDLASPPGEHWHEARRFVKTNFFLMQAANRWKKNAFPDNLIAICSILEQELGKWHDIALLNSLIIKQSENGEQDVSATLHIIKQKTIELQEKVSIRLPLLASACQSGEI
jgi:CHAD domain-containing protein